jgi:DNA processing protein
MRCWRVAVSLESYSVAVRWQCSGLFAKDYTRINMLAANGTDNLIRQGATLAEGAADVMAALEGMTRLPEPVAGQDTQLSEITTDSALETDRRTIEELLGPSPVMVDELVRQCHLSAPAVRSILLELELAGRLERHPGNRVSLLLTASAHGS